MLAPSYLKEELAIATVVTIHKISPTPLAPKMPCGSSFFTAMDTICINKSFEKQKNNFVKLNVSSALIPIGKKH
jgi:hypothetical protein